MPASSSAEDWVEVATPRFRVFSDAGERSARRVAEQLEQARLAFAQMLPGARTDPGVPVVVLAARDGETFRTLVPELWNDSGARPAGVFVRGRELHHVALRADVRGSSRRGDNPYQVLYHELAHLLLSLNFEHLPAWLSEGLAEFYGATELRDDAVIQGRPIPAHVHLLARHRLLPLERLFRVDHESPEYNEGSRAGVFYAESWALVHYQLTHPDGGGGVRLSTYQQALDEGLGPVEAGRRAFGDLEALEEGLRAHVTRGVFRWGRRPRPESEPEAALVVRAVDPAEALARIGEFHAARGQAELARESLEQALQRDPQLAMAHESLGMLALAEDDVAEAQARLERAVELAPEDPIARFRLARTLSLGTQRAGFEEARRQLEACLDLEPGYAPAWALLAEVRSRLKLTPFDETLALARRAVALEPGNFDYRLALARSLAATGRLAAAESEGQRALESARGPAERVVAGLFLAGLTEGTSALPEDDAEALRVLENLCGEGRVADCARLAERLRAGRGVAPDAERAAQLEEHACDAGHLPACTRLARAYEQGEGVPADPSRAALMHETACEAGAADSCGELAWALDRGHGVAVDPSRAASLYARACEAGMGWSCQQLGYLYERGRGVSRDLAEAARRYAVACDADEQFACWRLGRLREEGQGVAPDAAQAVALYESACRNGLPQACSDLGRVQAAGRGGAPDVAGAVASYRTACESGVDAACVSLGFLLLRGEGVSEDATEARRLFAEACERGEARGCTEAGLSELAEAGPGAQQRAAAWLERGCEGGEPRACSSLASQLEFGLGVPRDVARARALYRRACAAGHAPSCQRQRELR